MPRSPLWHSLTKQQWLEKNSTVAWKLFYKPKSVTVEWFSTIKCSPMLASKSQRETPSVMPIVSRDAQMTKPLFTHNAVMTGKHCNCSPQAFLHPETYKNMWFSTTKCSPMLPCKSQHHTLSVMPSVSCDAQISTLTFTHKQQWLENIAAAAQKLFCSLETIRIRTSVPQIGPEMSGFPLARKSSGFPFRRMRDWRQAWHDRYRTGQTTVNKWTPICYMIPINDIWSTDPSKNV